MLDVAPDRGAHRTGTHLARRAQGPSALLAVLLRLHVRRVFDASRRSATALLVAASYANARLRCTLGALIDTCPRPAVPALFLADAFPIHEQVLLVQFTGSPSSFHHRE